MIIVGLENGEVILFGAPIQGELVENILVKETSLSQKIGPLKKVCDAP